MKTGIMLVGLNGVNASTLISGCIAMKLKEIPCEYGMTQTDVFGNKDFINIDELVFSGWDYYNVTQYDLFKEYDIVKFSGSTNFLQEMMNIRPFKGIHTEKDIIIEDKFDYYVEPHNIEEAVNILENNIDDFKEKNSIENVIVIFLGSPSKKVSPKLKAYSYESFLNCNINSVPSSVIYALAAIRKRAHFVDFTPSETLEFSFLWNLAEEYKVQLSGRDGSTGQTMLKLTLANMLKIRNLRLRGWYSTNILGNHDGYILSNPEFNETKLEDKQNCIAPLLGYNDFEHKVTIDFFKTRFDSKESWDAIDFSGWLNTPMKLKVNWQGEDAILSAPLLIDIIRLIEFGARKGLSGFQKQLGLFFKHPFGCEGMSLETMYNNLIVFYSKI